MRHLQWPYDLFITIVNSIVIRKTFDRRFCCYCNFSIFVCVRFFFIRLFYFIFCYNRNEFKIILFRIDFANKILLMIFHNFCVLFKNILKFNFIWFSICYIFTIYLTVYANAANETTRKNKQSHEIFFFFSFCCCLNETKQRENPWMSIDFDIAFIVYF